MLHGQCFNARVGAARVTQNPSEISSIAELALGKAIVACAEVAPWWVYFLNGFAGLVYLHLDCIDGKQARRTKSSSPLGQLFDHGKTTAFPFKLCIVMIRARDMLLWCFCV